MFKRLFFAVVSILFFASITFSLPTQQANCLEWDKNPLNSVMNVTSYTVYWRDSGGVYSDVDSYATVDALSTKVCSADIATLATPDNKFYVVTALNAKGESQFSNEAQLVPLDQLVPGVPGMLRLVIN